MNKTVTVHIQKILFTLEEAAYNLLQSYLEQLKEYFGQQEGGEEIVVDIENRIAEHFSQKTNKKNAIITKADVEEIINTLGTVETLQSENEALTNEHPTPVENKEAKNDLSEVKDEPKPSTSKVRRLFRDPENGRIAGVAQGLGAYFSVDPIIVRAIFIAMVLFAGATDGASAAVAILGYFVMWAIVPPIRTMADRVEMEGQVANLSSLEDAFQKKFQQETPEIKDEKSKRLFPRMLNTSGNLLKKFGPFILRLTGFFVILAAFITFLAVTFAIIMILFNINSPYLNFPFLFLLQTNLFYLFTGLLYMLIAIPLLLVGLVGFSLFRLKNAITPFLGFALLTIWLVVLFAEISIGVKMAPEIEQEIRNNPGVYVAEQEDITIENYINASKLVVSGDIDFRLVPADEKGINLVGLDKDRPEVTFAYDQETDTLTIIRIEDDGKGPCIFCIESPVIVNLNGQVFEEVTATGAASVRLQDYTADTFVANLEGSAILNGDLTAETITITLKDHARAFLSGEGNSLNLTVSDFAYYRGVQFDVETATVTASDQTNVSLNRLKKLTITATEHANVHYRGNPELVENISEDSRLYKIDDTYDAPVEH